MYIWQVLLRCLLYTYVLFGKKYGLPRHHLKNLYDWVGQGSYRLYMPNSMLQNDSYLAGQENPRFYRTQRFIAVFTILWWAVFRNLFKPEAVGVICMWATMQIFSMYLRIGMKGRARERNKTKEGWTQRNKRVVEPALTCAIALLKSFFRAADVSL